MIKYVFLDIDGVITDGKLIIDSNGNEQKRINLKDVDAIFELKRKGFMIGAITGESSLIVEYFKNRFPWDFFYFGNKTKKETLIEICNKNEILLSEICYVGDGKYDVEALECVGLGICPKDSIDKAKSVSKIVLKKKGGDGCLWELVSLLDRINNAKESETFVYNKIFEHSELTKKLLADQKIFNEIIALGEKVAEILSNEGAVYICGNGGSAADAQHIATEFVSRFYKERKGLNVEALTTNTSSLTAIGNDYCFEEVFLRQLQAKAKAGDMLIGISTSGNSKNVIEALRYANVHNIHSAFLTGEKEKLEWENCTEHTIHVPSDDVPRIQEMHILIGHILAEYVENKLFN